MIKRVFDSLSWMLKHNKHKIYNSEIPSIQKCCPLCLLGKVNELGVLVPADIGGGVRDAFTLELHRLAKISLKQTLRLHFECGFNWQNKKT